MVADGQKGAYNMLESNYNRDYLKNIVKIARDNNYFGRIEGFYKKLPRTDCEKCGLCCTDPPACEFIEFLFAYEMYDTFDKDTKHKILIGSLRRYIYSLIDVRSYPCCFLNEDKLCLIYQRSCLSCKRWGTYSKTQYDLNWEKDSDYNKKYQAFYKDKYNIDIPDNVINAQLPFCEKVIITKNPYNTQEMDYQKYYNSLYAVNSKCLQHTGLSQNESWSINEWLVYFTFGRGIYNTRIELIQKFQDGDIAAVDEFVNNLDFDEFI